VPAAPQQFRNRSDAGRPRRRGTLGRGAYDRRGGRNSERRAGGGC
jgi:hypothetical protein